MKKVLILGANSYIGNSFQKYIGENYNDQYEVHKVSLRGEAWKEDDWSGYDSILNVTGKACGYWHPDRRTKTGILCRKL